jgi:hypothetical protein
MAEKWYLGFENNHESKIRTSELRERINKIIRQHSLNKYITDIKIEQGAQKNYYFFLEIESEKWGEIPNDIVNSQILNHLIFKKKFNDIFSYEKIQNMIEKDYKYRLPYSPDPRIFYDDPFDLSNQNINISSGGDTKTYQNLLYWLSSVGAGNWESFKKTCQILELNEPKQILRRLKILGHLEIYDHGKKWSINPTTLVEIDENKYIICGQQNLNLLLLLKRLKSSNKIKNFEIIKQPHDNAYPYVGIELDDLKILIKSIQDDLKIKIHYGNFSNRIAEFLPTIEEWKSNLENLKVIVTSKYKWKKFQDDIFVDSLSPQETGMYQMINKLGYPQTVFYYSSTDCFYQGDWYGLRFLSLYYAREKCLANYYVKTSCLAIPKQQRWPEIYERALILASGKLPTHQNSLLFYKNIKPHLAKQLADKLEINLEEINN